MSFSSPSADHSPVGRVPAEVMARTFELGVLSFSTGLSVFGRNPSHYLRYLENLAQVCVFWREIALSTSRLWVNLYITTSTQLPRILAWIARSGVQKLRIHINYSFPHFLTVFTPFDNIMQCLIPHVHRWVELTASLVGPWGLSPEVLLQRHFCAPSVQHTHYRRDQPWIPGGPLVWLRAPLLHLPPIWVPEPCT